MKSARIKEKVITEGAEIYCERRGNGPLLLMITGAMGDADFYSSAGDILADEFTVVSYDRRSNSRSTGGRTTDMKVGQQARDAAVIIKAMSADRALIFGSSGGGIIGLELAAIKPEVIDFLIVHEAPVIELLPDVEKWRSFHHDIYTKSQCEGWEAALAEFMASLIGVPDSPYPPDLNERVSGNMEFFFKHEYKAFIQYMPDLKRIRDNKVRMVVAVGQDSGDAYYVQSTRALAARVGCDYVEFPSHHDVSFHMPEEFAKALRSAIERWRRNKEQL
jgi:pimeloyl-ACP methyl ester carboxylesterase